jgi:hypothetical protein
MLRKKHWWSFCTFCWNKFRVAASCGLGWQQWGETVVNRRYLTRQTSALIKFAQTTINPKLAAVLVHRAADLKAQLDETMPPVDPSPQAPDVEPPAQSSAWRQQMIEKFNSPQVFIRFQSLRLNHVFQSPRLNHLAGWTTTKSCRYFCALPETIE